MLSSLLMKFSNSTLSILNRSCCLSFITYSTKVSISGLTLKASTILGILSSCNSDSETRYDCTLSVTDLDWKAKHSYLSGILGL